MMFGCVAVAAGADLDGELALYLPLTRDLNDHSSHQQPVVNVGHVELKPEGAWFGGRKDWLEAPFIDLHDRPFAIALWIKEMSLNRQVGLVEQFDLDQQGHHLHLMLRGNRQPYLGFNAADLASPLGIPREHGWMHVVFQFTGEFQQIWLDGHLVASRRGDPYRGTYGVTAIGKTPRWGNVPAQDFVGFMREVRLYQRALALDEIAELSGRRWLPGGGGPEEGPVDATKAPGQGVTVASMLPVNAALPFLEIDGRRITVNGRPGQVYELQGTSDFSRWTPLGRSTNETGRVVYVESPEAPAMQFYRVLVVIPGD